MSREDGEARGWTFTGYDGAGNSQFSIVDEAGTTVHWTINGNGEAVDYWAEPRHTTPEVSISPTADSIFSGQPVSFNVSASNESGLQRIGLELCDGSGNPQFNLGENNVSGTSASGQFEWYPPGPGTYLFDGYAWNDDLSKLTRTGVVAITVNDPTPLPQPAYVPPEPVYTPPEPPYVPPQPEYVPPATTPQVSFFPDSDSIFSGQPVVFNVNASNQSGLRRIGLELCDANGSPTYNLGENEVSGNYANGRFAWYPPGPGTYLFDAYAWSSDLSLLTRTGVVAITVNDPTPLPQPAYVPPEPQRVIISDADAAARGWTPTGWNSAGNQTFMLVDSAGTTVRWETDFNGNAINFVATAAPAVAPPIVTPPEPVIAPPEPVYVPPEPQRVIISDADAAARGWTPTGWNGAGNQTFMLVDSAGKTVRWETDFNGNAINFVATPAPVIVPPIVTPPEPVYVPPQPVYVPPEPQRVVISDTDAAARGWTPTGWNSAGNQTFMLVDSAGTTVRWETDFNGNAINFVATPAPVVAPPIITPPEPVYIPPEPQRVIISDADAAARGWTPTGWNGAGNQTFMLVDSAGTTVRWEIDFNGNAINFVATPAPTQPVIVETPTQPVQPSRVVISDAEAAARGWTPTGYDGQGNQTFMLVDSAGTTVRWALDFNGNVINVTAEPAAPQPIVTPPEPQRVVISDTDAAARGWTPTGWNSAGNQTFMLVDSAGTTVRWETDFNGNAINFVATPAAAQPVGNVPSSDPAYVPPQPQRVIISDADAAANGWTPVGYDSQGNQSFMLVDSAGTTVRWEIDFNGNIINTRATPAATQPPQEVPQAGRVIISDAEAAARGWTPTGTNSAGNQTFMLVDSAGTTVNWEINFNGMAVNFVAYPAGTPAPVETPTPQPQHAVVSDAEAAALGWTPTGVNSAGNQTFMLVDSAGTTVRWEIDFNGNAINVTAVPRPVQQPNSIDPVVQNPNPQNAVITDAQAAQLGWTPNGLDAQGRQSFYLIDSANTQVVWSIDTNGNAVDTVAHPAGTYSTTVNNTGGTSGGGSHGPIVSAAEAAQLGWTPNGYDAAGRQSFYLIDSAGTRVTWSMEGGQAINVTATPAGGSGSSTNTTPGTTTNTGGNTPVYTTPTYTTPTPTTTTTSPLFDPTPRLVGRDATGLQVFHQVDEAGNTVEWTKSAAGTATQIHYVTGPAATPTHVVTATTTQIPTGNGNGTTTTTVSPLFDPTHRLVGYDANGLKVYHQVDEAGNTVEWTLGSNGLAMLQHYLTGPAATPTHVVTTTQIIVPTTQQTGTTGTSKTALYLGLAAAGAALLFFANKKK